jgi:arginyl-tRNA---protein transferase
MESKSTNVINLYQVHGYNPGSCGYCHSKDGHYTIGFTSEILKSETYQEMMDRGWRRCGKYYYKPDNVKQCCKMYTIRLEANQHQIRHSHKKTMKRFQKYLDGHDVRNGEHSKDEEDITEQQPKKTNISVEVPKSEDQEKLENILNQFIEKIKENRQILGALFDPSKILTVSEAIEKSQKVTKSASKKFGDYSSPVLLKLFGENKKDLNLNNPKDFIEKLRTFSLEYLTPIVAPVLVNIQDSGHITFTSKLEEKEIVTEEVKTEQLKPKEKKEKIKPEKFAEENKSEIVTQKQQNDLQIENKTPSLEIKGTQILKKRNFEIKFEKAKFDQEAFNMYQKYCKDIHEKEKEDKKGYTDFLCLQSLEYKTLESQGKKLDLGCYHMKYYIDGKFVAVGVVDITQYTLSSVYFFYDPEYKNLSLGVVGGIKEIEYVKEMNKYFPEFKYYYLGYYIHDNKKMLYKGDYEPAQLLCPITYTWVPLNDDTRKNCDKKEYRLSSKQTLVIEDMDFSQNNLEKFVKDKVKLSINGADIKLVQFNKRSYEYFLGAFKDVVQGLGKKLVSSLVFAQKD